MKELTDYELQKMKNKRNLVRNTNKTVGKYEIPLIKKQEVDLNKINFLSFVGAKSEEVKNKDKSIHFFTHDWLFDRVYDKAESQIEKLKQYNMLLSPDFSMFTDMPLALQIHSVFKNRWCGAYWQSLGMTVIPTISWGDEKSFEFCFDGVEVGSIVAVCTYYRENAKEEFMVGYNRMLEVIKPKAIICYDEPFQEMKGNIKSFLPTTYEWTKDLSWQEYANFYVQKNNRNVIK